MEHLWPVTVVDNAGGTVSGARVCLVKASALGGEHFPYRSLVATHTAKKGGRYEPNAPIVPTDGEWVLVVTLKGKAPVVQPLRITTAKDKGDFTTGVRGGAVATVNITSAVRTIGKSKSRETAFNVRLFPAAELVFLGGVDYSKMDVSTGWMFHLYGFHRAEVLRREKKLHPGTIVTVFSTAKITRTTRVWGEKKGAPNWVDVEVARLGNPATRTLPVVDERYQPEAGLDIHITDFYKYLDKIGKLEPKSVVEAGIFSHSYPGGPILYNTDERAPFVASPDRDPMDFDARGKDFNSTNLPLRGDMRKSFAPGARFTVWGCSATQHTKNRCREALESIRRGSKEDEYFLVKSSHLSHDGAVESTEEEYTTELRHRWEMDTEFRKEGYAAEAARELAIEVRAACPGCGTNPVVIDGIETMIVKIEDYKSVFDYFHLKFAPEFAETRGKWDRGFIDYHKMRSRTAIPKPAFDSAYYSFVVVLAEAPPFAVLTFWNEKTVRHSTAAVSLRAMAVTSLVTAGKKGHLYVLKDTDDTKSQAVYLQEDGRLFEIERDAAKAWKVVGPEL